MSAFSAARMTVRGVGLVMLVLGLVIWTGSADGLVPIHMLLGIVLVLALWAVAALAFQAGTRPALPVLTIAFGLAQAQILPDASEHLVVEVAHLFVGLVAIGLAEAVGAITTRSGAAAGR